MTRKSFSLVLMFALLLQMFFLTGVSQASPLLPAPDNVYASHVTSSTIPLYWNSVSGADLYAIRVNGTEVFLSNTTSYTITGRTPNTTYYVEVSGIAPNQSGWQTWSTPRAIKTALPAPIGLYITQATSTSASLSWDPISGADYYLIKVNGNFMYSTQDSVYTVPNLTPNTAYTLSVHALQPGGGYVGDGAVEELTTPLTAPTGVQVTDTTDKTVSISWNAVPTATMYYFKINGSYHGVSSEYTSFTFNNLTPETTYAIQVAATNGAPNNYMGDFSTALNATTKAPAPVGPAVPANLVASANENSITLNWAAAAGADSYKVYKDGVLVTTVSGTSYTFTGLGANKTYNLGVAGYDSMGVKESAVASISGLTAPFAPIDLTTGVTDKTITLSWAPAAGATSYALSLNGTAVTTTTNTSYSFTGLNADTLYTVGVSSVNAGGTSTLSTIKATTAKVVLPKLFLDTPVDVSLGAGASQSYVFTPSTTGMHRFYTGPYQGYGGANDTVLELYADSAMTSLIASNDDFNGTSFSEVSANLTAGVSYYVKLKPYDAGTPLYTTLKVSKVQASTNTPITLNKPIDFDITAGSSKVFEFTAGTTAVHNIYTDYYAGTSASGASDTILYVYSDAALTSLIASNDDYTGTFSRVTPSLTAGKTYYIKIVGYNNASVHARLAVTL